METRKDSSWTKTGMFILTCVNAVFTILGVIVMVASLGLVYWIWQHPNPAQAPPLPGGVLMNTYWWPAALLLIAQMIFVSAQILVARLLGGKLRKRIADLSSESGKLTRDYQLCRDNYSKVEKERDTAWERLKELEPKLTSLEIDLKNETKRVNDETNQRNNWIKSYNDASRKLAELGWVQKILEEQETALQDHVVINLLSQVRVDLIDTPYGPPRIRFGFRVRNESLFDITIHRNEVGGHVSFQERLLKETVSFDQNSESTVENLRHKQDGWIMLDQEFTASEIDRIKKALSSNGDSKFSFDSVVIKVSGGTNFTKLTAKTLPIPDEYRRIKLSQCKMNSNATSSGVTARLEEQGKQ